jgi:hypothetical protein
MGKPKAAVVLRPQVLKSVLYSKKAVACPSLPSGPGGFVGGAERRCLSQYEIIVPQS